MSRNVAVAVAIGLAALGLLMYGGKIPIVGKWLR